MTYGTRLGLVTVFVLLNGCRIEIESDESGGAKDSESFGDHPGWGEDPVVWPPPEPPAPWIAEPRPVDPFRELVIIDPSVVLSKYASNAESGAAFSFRAQMAWFSGASDDGLGFTLRWLDRWATVTSAGDYLAPVTPRPLVREKFIDRWLSGSSPIGTPSEMRGARAYEHVDGTSAWQSLPILLIAIVNRADLAVTHDSTLWERGCAGAGGELRFVYAALDPTLRTPLPMSIIVEIPYPEELSIAGWTQALHDIAARPFGSDYNSQLADFVTRVRAGSDPRRARIRTNEQAFGSPWELREFALAEPDAEAPAHSERELVLRPLEFTPRLDVDPKRIDAHLAGRSDEVLRGPVALPEELRAGVAQIPGAGFRWTSSALSPALTQAFSRETCNGCHGGDAATLPFQHIALDEIGAFPARLSRFLNDPASPLDELRRRAVAAERLLASTCTAE